MKIAVIGAGAIGSVVAGYLHKAGVDVILIGRQDQVDAIKKDGALAVYAAITHPVLCGPAVERIKKSSLKEVIVTDTIPIPEKNKPKNIKILSVASLLGEAIKRIHNEESVSVLFS